MLFYLHNNASSATEIENIAKDKRLPITLNHEYTIVHKMKSNEICVHSDVKIPLLNHYLTLYDLRPQSHFSGNNEIYCKNSTIQNKKKEKPID